MDNATALQDLLIGRFIARPDCYAVQGSDGKWFPARESVQGVAYEKSPLMPWSRDVLQAHIDGALTVGHYMLSQDSQVNLMAFDIDFADRGFCPASYTSGGVPRNYELIQLRDEWHDRASYHRRWLKTRLRTVTHMLASAMHSELEIPVAAAYSGSKGVHVYGFTGTMAAVEVRMAAEMVMKEINAVYADSGTNFELSRGSFEWTDKNNDLDKSFQNLTIEVFPKNDEIAEGGFGNLMAMPLGINRKHPDDPKFFFDLRAPLDQLVPADPIWALSTNNAWEQ